MVSIYDYTDFRAYLRDLQKEHKAADLHFSYRYIARRLGVSSATVWDNILHGRNRLTPRLLAKTVEMFGLSTEEAEYLKLLVGLSQARSDDERRLWTDRLSQALPAHVQRLRPQQHAYYRKWYHSAIWAMMIYYPFDGDYRKLGKALSPPISAAQARQAMKLLLRLGLLEADGKGRYKQVDPLITSGDQAASAALRAFQMQTLALATKAYDKVPREQRQFASLDVTFGAKEYQAALDCVKQCRAKLLRIARQSAQPDRVYHMGFQAFPLTRIENSPAKG